MTAFSPSNIEERHRNKYYKTEEEYPGAIAEAMREEYKAILDAGFLLQIDDPRLVTYYMGQPTPASPRAASGRGRASSSQPRAARHPRRTRCAITPATASTWARACTTWR